MSLHAGGPYVPARVSTFALRLVWRGSFSFFHRYQAYTCPTHVTEDSLLSDDLISRALWDFREYWILNRDCWRRLVEAAPRVTSESTVRILSGGSETFIKKKKEEASATQAATLRTNPSRRVAIFPSSPVCLIMLARVCARVCFGTRCRDFRSFVRARIERTCS